MVPAIVCQGLQCPIYFDHCKTSSDLFLRSLLRIPESIIKAREAAGLTREELARR